MIWQITAEEFLGQILQKCTIPLKNNQYTITMQKDKKGISEFHMF